MVHCRVSKLLIFFLGQLIDFLHVSFWGFNCKGPKLKMSKVTQILTWTENLVSKGRSSKSVNSEKWGFPGLFFIFWSNYC